MADGQEHRARPDDRTERLLRAALSAQADGVDPGPAPRLDDLHGSEVPWSGRRWLPALAVAASVAVVAAAVATAVAVLPGDGRAAPAAAPTVVVTTTVTPSPDGSTSGPAPVPVASLSPTASGVVTPAPPAVSSPAPTEGPDDTPDTPEPAGDASVVVWAVTPDDDEYASPLVVPERRTGDLPSGTGMTTTESRVSAALVVLLTREPLDPDYDNPWAYGAATREPLGPADVAIGPDGTTVDFPGAPSGLDTGYYVGALTEQLVRTVVSNGGTQPVSFLVDGQVQPFVQLDWSEPRRTGGVPLVGGWVLDPWHGQRVAAGAVTVSGTATAFEATVAWEVADGSGAVVAEGVTTAGANGQYGPFTFTVDLPPGTYTVTVGEPSAAGEDEGPALVWQDTKTIEVVG